MPAATLGRFAEPDIRAREDEIARALDVVGRNLIGIGEALRRLGQKLSDETR